MEELWQYLNTLHLNKIFSSSDILKNPNNLIIKIIRILLNYIKCAKASQPIISLVKGKHMWNYGNGMKNPKYWYLMQAVVSEAALQSLEGALSSHNPIKSAVIIQRTLGHA